jgi:hypothetical protein
MFTLLTGIFGTGKVAYSFSSAGTTTIAAPAGTYQVQLRYCISKWS